MRRLATLQEMLRAAAEQAGLAQAFAALAALAAFAALGGVRRPIGREIDTLVSTGAARLYTAG
jgi:hypothetical protein